MESAIAPHLSGPRLHAAALPEGYRPPYPSFVSRHDPSVRQVVIAFLGARDGGTPDVLGPDAPRHHDRAVTDGPTGGETVTAAYWTDPLAFERWFDRHRESWLSRDGRWVEAIRPSVRRMETIVGSRRHPEGLAAVADGFSGEIREHGYWGSMRDRLPASATEELADAAVPEVVTDGGRVRVRMRGSVCLIRSGQDWSGTHGDERATYLDGIEPLLREGMAFLADEGAAQGCLSNRYLTLVQGGERAERTYGLGWWRTLADLERWSATHPTHLAIFRAFGRAVRAQGGRSALRLYHEVAVAGPNDQWFEYAGCAPGTGLLAAAGSPVPGAAAHCAS